MNATSALDNWFRRTDTPEIIVVAGPNGAGKSTFTSKIRELGYRVLDPDRVAKNLNPENPAKAGFSAGKFIIRELQLSTDSKESIVLESTISGTQHLKHLRNAKEKGYSVALIYIGLDGVDLSRNRVNQRVKKGGHDIPSSDLARRYPRSMKNASLYASFADSVHFFDNSGSAALALATITQGEVQVHAKEDPPGWFQRVLDDYKKLKENEPLILSRKDLS